MGVNKMMMEQFYNRFPRVAEQETRAIVITDATDIDLPPGEYYFTESFCNDIKCDCRRVFLNVIHNDKIVATIGYGWEDLEFYKAWFKGSNFDLLPGFKGPVLEMGQVQSKYAKTILKLFEDVLLEDIDYIDRIKNHYDMFKGSLKKKKIGRNEPCHCGSGIKYKKCCLKDDEGKKID
jgi:hypothetical protein